MRRSAILVALMPLAMTPAVFWFLAEHGGSEKDMVWIVPWIVWSAAFGGFSFALAGRPWSWRRRFGTALLFATCVVIVLATGLALAGQLGIAGRF